MCGKINRVHTLVEFLVMMTAVAVVSNCTVIMAQHNTARSTTMIMLFKKGGVGLHSCGSHR